MLIHVPSKLTFYDSHFSPQVTHHLPWPPKWPDLVAPSLLRYLLSALVPEQLQLLLSPSRCPLPALGAVPAARCPPACQLHLQPALGLAHSCQHPAGNAGFPCLPGHRGLQLRYAGGHAWKGCSPTKDLALSPVSTSPRQWLLAGADAPGCCECAPADRQWDRSATLRPHSPVTACALRASCPCCGHQHSSLEVRSQEW